MVEWDRKCDVKHYYNSTAHIYDMRYAEEQIAKIGAVMGSLNMEIQSLVLDVGCGTGILFDYTADKAKAIVGLDISRKILFQAKERAKKFPNVDLILADADNMPLKGDVFNLLFAVTLIQNMPSPVKTLNEVKRVTKKNALMVVTGLKKKFPVQAFKRLLRNAGLNVITLKIESLKCYVAVCSKSLR